MTCLQLPRALLPESRANSACRYGASAVEFAFVGPVLLLIVFGIFEWGRCFMVQALLNEAAREGCRTGVVEGTTTAQIQSAATTYLTNMGISGDTASVLINGSSGTQAQNVAAFTEITVQVSVPFNSVTWFPVGAAVYLPGVGSVGAGPNVTLTGQCTLRRE